MPAEDPEFRVVYSGAIQEKLQELVRKAEKAGKLKRFTQAIREMDKRLHQDPLGFGEMIGKLHFLKLVLQVGFVRPLQVKFAVHEEQRFVIVQKIESVTSLDES